MLPIVSNEPGKVHLGATMSHVTALGDMVGSAGSVLEFKC